MIRENRAVGSLLDLLIKENDIMLKIEDGQTAMAEAIKIREGLLDIETAKIEYLREEYEKRTCYHQHPGRRHLTQNTQIPEIWNRNPQRNALS